MTRSLLLLPLYVALARLWGPTAASNGSFPTFRAVDWSLATASDVAAAEAALTAPIGCSCVSTR